jgi:hypothetical protein
MRFTRSTTEVESAGAVDHGTPAADEAYELSAIDLYMTDGRRKGWVATNGRRTSDWLNAADPLPVHGVIAVEAADPPDVAPPPVDTSGTEVSQLAVEDVLFVVPPPLPPNRHLRLHRRRVHIQVRVGDATINGQAHVRPGAQAGDHIFRSGRRFVPLTDAEVVLNEGSTVWLLPVVIINAAAVGEIHGLEETRVRAELPVSPAPAPDPQVGLPEPVAAASPPAEQTLDPEASRRTILLTALELLLEEGVLDVVEFQTKRAKLLAD